uniref:Uncharacterized protein n=2 Tax=Timema TaxID=61471 RepID=A0A7R9NX87_9NEOP|nr:unnamed protein product [Timema tahoe]
MRYSVVTLALLVLSVGVTQGKPGRHDKQPGVTHAPVTAAMTTTHAPVMAAMTTAADTDMAAEEQDNSSSEESGSSSQESSEEDVNIQSKTADLCVKHPELTEIESQCVAEYKAMKKAKCNSTTEEAGVMEGIKDKMKEGMETVKTTAKGIMRKAKELVGMNTTESSNTTHAHGSTHHRRRSLDEGMWPVEEKIQSWISTNITDEKERKSLQTRTQQCFSDLREKGVIPSKGDNMDSSSSSKEVGTMPVTYVVHVPGACPRCKEMSCVVFAEGNPGKKECNAYSQLLMCLAKVEAEECSSFKFP